jgi:hypothetical protein
MTPGEYRLIENNRGTAWRDAATTVEGDDLADLRLRCPVTASDLQ